MGARKGAEGVHALSRGAGGAEDSTFVFHQEFPHRILRMSNVERIPTVFGSVPIITVLKPTPGGGGEVQQLDRNTALTPPVQNGSQRAVHDISLPLHTGIHHMHCGGTE